MKIYRTELRFALVATLLAVACALAAAQAAQAGSGGLPSLSGEEIMRMVDKNSVVTTMTYTGTMSIDLGDRVLEKSMQVMADGAGKSLVEFTNAEDRGVRYLKVDKDLWMYFPVEQETVRISGHLLKEGMMGSDVSYEDALESGALADKYTITVLGSETLEGRPAYVLDMKAKVKTVNYDRQKYWVDAERFVVLKAEMYAKSGRLLKESRSLSVRKFGTRWFATEVRMEDKLKKGGGTVFTMNDVLFDVKLPDDTFSLRALGR